MTWWLNVIFGGQAVAVALRGSRAGKRGPPQGVPRTLRAPAGDRGCRCRRRAPAAHAGRRRSASQGPPRRVRRPCRGRRPELLRAARAHYRANEAGAGKTTTFDACSGLNRRIGGRISLRGKEMTRLGVPARGRLSARPGPSSGWPCASASRSRRTSRSAASPGWAAPASWASSRATRSQRADTRAAAWSAMELCGITELAGTQAGALSTGQRRLVELARCLAGQFDVLILDEPSSGLDHAETEALARILRRTVMERGCGILLVEHDMSLVMNVCEYIYVLDFGKLLFEGDPLGVAASPEVQAGVPGLCDRGGEGLMTSSVQQPASSNGSGPGLPPLALELRDVTGGYGQTTVLRGVSITVPASGVVALLGPNGAGKTTLLRTVSGFLRPSSQDPSSCSATTRPASPPTGASRRGCATSPRAAACSGPSRCGRI